MERFDFNYPPYHVLNGNERLTLQNVVDIAFYRDEELIIEPNRPIEFLYVVMKGVVKEVGCDGEVAAVYRAHDTFEARALVEGTSQNSFVVAEEALVYKLPKACVLHLMEGNSRFGSYFYASVAEKLANRSESSDEDEFESLFTAKVRDAYRDNAVWLDGNATVLEAAHVMKERKTKTLLLHHEGKTGLFTESAFRDIVIEGASFDDPVYKWSPPQLITADIDDFVFNALLRMMESRIQRVIVTENGKAIGALEQLDILAYFSNHTHVVVQRIEKAESIDDLAELAAHMNGSIQALQKNGVRAKQLAQLMRVSNSALFEKAWRLLASEHLYEHSCLLVMGSEGRSEQILKTDQDNALILAEGVDLAEAQATAEKFSAALELFGYPPCKGGIMVCNPMWRKPIGEFKKMIGGWLSSATPANMMNLAIFIDAKAVAGDVSLLDELNNYLYRRMDKDVGILMNFARAVDLFEDHSRRFMPRLLQRNNRKMDVKKIGIFPIVHGVRALALEARLEANNSFERINILVARNILEPQAGRDLAEALGYLMDLRLKGGLMALNDPMRKLNNQVDTDKLSTLERDLLKDSLNVVKRFKQTVRHHFHLGG
ncbi:DUF294 nucleotidyltransferase-like domain-containing protein [Neisseria yangbaofengii]|uniref:DUF294 nucleotidyltransferase-like domain-containing protein n=1 Tax=Neisseria yangbaofengii TaxID=2709396 RepID=UPI0013EC9B82|nr:DUF294 nucleotidyltransferase-like domain-containing protein [Neisseria yangbaofengii]